MREGVLRSLRFLFSPRGRAGRPAFALFQLVMLPLVAVYFGVRRNFDIGPETPFSPAVAGFLVSSTLILWAELAVIARRLHDFNFRGWWWLVLPLCAYIAQGLPFLALLALCVMPGQAAANRFGPPPPTVKQFLAERKIARLTRDFAAGKMSAEEFSAKRAQILSKACRELGHM